MIKKTMTAAVATLVLSQGLVPEAAMARHVTHHRVYHGRAYDNRHRCSGGNGAVGTIGGGVGGALVGNAIVGGPVGTIAGGVGGALLGRHLDKQNTRHRHGC